MGADYAEIAQSINRLPMSGSSVFRWIAVLTAFVSA